MGERTEPPLVIASTLLIPGYIDEEEIGKLSHFISLCNPDIPYKLLGFHPQLFLYALPPTSKNWLMPVWRWPGRQVFPMLILEKGICLHDWRVKLMRKLFPFIFFRWFF
ncbi:MAG: hypothetical protein ACQEP5_05390 [Actinomycetota bacterium]